MNDALLDEIAARPDEDDARLVWADREGGERGELVVIQCALAKDGQPREERRKLYARERELLEMAMTWPEARGVEDPRFERGFIVRATVDIDDLPKHLARHPLLTSVTLADARVDVVDGQPDPGWLPTGRRIARVFADLPPGRITKVTAEPLLWVDAMIPRTESQIEAFIFALSGTHAGRALRGLELAGSVPAGGLDWLAGFADLEELRLAVNLTGQQLKSFVATHPRLERLSLSRRARRSPSVDVPVFAAATELSLSHAGFGDVHFRQIANAELPNLRRLGLRWTDATRHGFVFLAQSSKLARLEALDLSGTKLDDETIALLATAHFAPNLRELVASEAQLTAAAIPHLLSFPVLDRLDLRSSYVDTAVFAPLKSVIPSVFL